MKLLADSSGFVLYKYYIMQYITRSYKASIISILALCFLSILKITSFGWTEIDSPIYTQTFGKNDGQYFSQLYGIDLDANNNIYIVSKATFDILKLDPSGNLIMRWGTNGVGDGQFKNLTGVKVSKSGFVYVTDFDNSTNYIQKFDLEGNFILKWGGTGNTNGKFDYPAGLWIDSSENVWVVDRNNHRVQVFDANGTFITTFGSFGSNNGQFNYPSGITIDKDKNFYVLERTGCRISKFDKNGTFIKNWGSPGSADGQLSNPIGIFLDKNENLVVGDQVNNRIQVFDKEGNFLSKFGSYGSATGQFYYPLEVTVDNDNNYYIVDNNNSRIQKFSSNGTFITKFDGSSASSEDGEFNRPSGMAFDSIGNMYIADANNHRIQKLDANGNFIKKWGSLGSADGQFSMPITVAINKINNLYVVDYNNRRIQEFDLEGNFVRKWGSYGTANGQFTSPQRIVFDQDNNLYINDAYGNYRIQKFSSTGIFIKKWGTQGTLDGQFSFNYNCCYLGYQMAFNSNNELLVLDGKRVQKFDVDGTYISKFGTEGTSDGQFLESMGMVLDSNGNILISDYTKRNLQKFNTNGNFISKWGSSGYGNGQFISPIYLEFDQAGNLFVVDSSLHIIQKYIFDLVAPAITINTIPNNLTNQSSPIITGTVIDDFTNITAIEYQLDSIANSWQSCSLADGNMDSISENFNCILSNAPDGNHFIYIRSSDSKTNINTEENYGEYSFVKDTTPPQLSIESANNIIPKDQSINFLINSEDNLTNVTSVDFQIDNTSKEWITCPALDGTFDSVIEDVDCTLPADLSIGKHLIYFKSSDKAGNESTSESYLTYAVTVQTLLTKTGSDLGWIVIIFKLFAGYFLLTFVLKQRRLHLT